MDYHEFKLKVFRLSINMRFLSCLCLFPLLLIGSLTWANALPPLTLTEAEQLATRCEPTLQRLCANTKSLEQQAIAEGQFSDPQLVVGVNNVPTNTFSFTQDDMTMITAGVQQALPRGHSLKFKSCQTQALAQAERYRIRQQHYLILRTVRESWLELYYWAHTTQVLQENQYLLQKILKLTRAEYSTAKKSLQDVLQTQVELTRLEAKQTEAQQQIALQSAQLGRWIGMAEASRPLAHLPQWSILPPLCVLQKHLCHHPLLQVDTAMMQSNRHGLALAREQYKPGFDVSVSYEARQGSFMNSMGMPRSDMVTAQVTMDLPVFTANRQDRRFKASEEQFKASIFNRDADCRNLSTELAGQYANWNRIKQRVELLQKHLRPEAKQNVKAALLAYRSANADLLSVLRAYNTLLEVQLEELRGQVDAAKAYAILLYLGGESGCNNNE